MVVGVPRFGCNSCFRLPTPVCCFNNLGTHAFRGCTFQVIGGSSPWGLPGLVRPLAWADLLCGPKHDITGAISLTVFRGGCVLAQGLGVQDAS
jgi:hypothetical protein